MALRWQDIRPTSVANLIADAIVSKQKTHVCNNDSDFLSVNLNVSARWGSYTVGK
jgi:hypothetical protein